MARKEDSSSQERAGAFHEEVGKKEERKIQAREEKHRGLWYGLGMFGLVGWSIALPTVVGTLLGVWIDRKWPSQYSWTITALIGGAALGCWHAWFWVNRENRRR